MTREKEFFVFLSCVSWFKNKDLNSNKSLPPTKMKLVQAWIEIHRDELLADWKLAVAGDTAFKIDPLVMPQLKLDKLKPLFSGVFLRIRQG